MAEPASDLKADDLAEAERVRGAWFEFSPGVECAFRDFMIEGQHRSVIVHWLFGIGLFDLFLVNDYLVAPDDILLYATGRLGCMTPICLGALFVASRFRRVYESAICLLPITMSGVLSILLLETDGAYRHFYMLGHILLMMCGAVISRSRFRFAFCTAVIQSVCYGVDLFLSTATPPDTVLPGALSCLTGAIFALLTAHTLDQSSRTTFLMGARIRLLNRELEAAATTDPLTGLANRRGLAHVTDRLWASNHEPAVVVSLILIDVDRFKLFNDNYGHAAGDECLVVIARQILSVLRSDDDLAVRFGGEEMLVLLPDLSFVAAQLVAERIRMAVIAADIPHPVLGSGAVVTASMGVACATIRECSLLQLTAMADNALYSAKAAGRNCVWPPLDARVDPVGKSTTPRTLGMVG